MVTNPSLTSIEEDAIVLGLEPLHAILLLEPVAEAELAAHQLSVLDPQAWACQMHVEIHAIDASGGIVLAAQIDLLRATEAEGTAVSQVPLAQLILKALDDGGGGGGVAAA